MRIFPWSQMSFSIEPQLFNLSLPLTVSVVCIVLASFLSVTFVTELLLLLLQVSL